MAPTGALASNGTLLKLNGTTIAEVQDINGLDIENLMAEATNQSSAGWFEQIPVLQKQDDLTFNIQFIPTDGTHNYTTGLYHQLYATSLATYTLVWSNVAGTTWTFSAYVKSIKPKAVVAGKLEAAVTLAPSGAPTLA